MYSYSQDNGLQNSIYKTKNKDKHINKHFKTYIQYCHEIYDYLVIYTFSSCRQLCV